MTRRIALAILMTVWAILIAGCATAYLSMRTVLIDQLDESLKSAGAGVAGTQARSGERKRDWR